jgi:hypothetical protein
MTNKGKPPPKRQEKLADALKRNISRRKAAQKAKAAAKK